ncbi:hypothetical protein FI615_001700 [Enterococcus faecium]|uniref:hypothetical protein n=1 Tax=Enterococcus faecium TaxID=1352 RepID=UPI001922B749|nr:hypothetical protein [Enterococcus faecium]EGP4894213.1 hypothetical protein [Enterococcus faecium]EHK9936769.1 hypothetical protein [Enterococcus faecium]MBL3708361.1 hypothetical protein [Enterococcus faecium]
MGGLLNNCRPKFKSCAAGKLQSDSVAYFYKIRDPKLCNIYGFKTAVASHATILYSHNYKDKPEEKICGLDKCDMSGTLFVTPETGEQANQSNVMTQIKANGEDFQFGYLRLFMYGVGEYKIIIQNLDDDKNMNIYNVEVLNDSWNPVMLELFNPDEVIGTGWIGKNSGIVIIVEPKQSQPYRLSTIEIFETIQDIVSDMTIGFTCITDFSGDPSLTITEDLCDVQGYDSKATKIERSLTANNIIGELAEFHNITKRQKELEHLVQTRGEFIAKEETDNGIRFATFTIPELADIRCPRLLIQPLNCETNPFYHVDIDNDMNLIAIQEDQFFRKGNKVYVNEAYIDTKFVVAYPIFVEGIAWDITTEEMENIHYQMEMTTPICGDEYVIKADNVLLTALPFTWTSEAGQFTVPFTMAKDNQGKFGTIIKVDKRK